MVSYRLKLAAVAAALALAMSGEARAGGPVHAGCCVAPVPIELGEMYVVNQGPLLSGPGHYLERETPDPLPPVGRYPYVGPVFTGYPFGVWDQGLYPRGTFSPFAGYPYVEPPPGLEAPSYIDYQMRSGPIYRRAIGLRGPSPAD
jgi:hypothetical protein